MGWAFRAALSGIDGITLHPLRGTDPMLTGKIPGSQGFDVAQAAFRKALHTPLATRGRCDLHGIRFQGRPVGVYSAYDLSSGIGYHYYTGCRGVAPHDARELAMNAFLLAYALKIGGTAG